MPIIVATRRLMPEKKALSAKAHIVLKRRGFFLQFLFFVLLSLFLISGCALKPTVPLSVQGSVANISPTPSTFSVNVYPAPGQTAFLRSYEHVLTRVMKEKGYQWKQTEGDLVISLRLQRISWNRDLSKPIESGRLLLQMNAGDKTIRTGRSGILSSNDLDFPRAHTRRERIRLFLQGL